MADANRQKQLTSRQHCCKKEAVVLLLKNCQHNAGLLRNVIKHSEMYLSRIYHLRKQNAI